MKKREEKLKDIENVIDYLGKNKDKDFFVLLVTNETSFIGGEYSLTNFLFAKKMFDKSFDEFIESKTDRQKELIQKMLSVEVE